MLPGEVEVLVRLAEPSKVIEILTRGTKETRPECYALMQRFYFIVSEAVHETNPGTSTVTYIPSARHLKEHRKHPAMYSSAEVFGAERGMEWRGTRSKKEIQTSRKVFSISFAVVVRTS